MKKIYSILLYLILIGLVVYVLYDFDFQQVLVLLQNIDWSYLVLAILAFGLSILVWNLRFKISLSELVSIRYFKLLRILLASIFINSITPGSAVGGEPIRAYYLNKEKERSKTEYMGAIFADKVINYLVFLVFVLFSIFFLLAFISIPRGFKIFLFFILGSLFFAGLFLFILHWSRFRFGLRWLVRQAYRLTSVSSRFKSLKRFELYLIKKKQDFTGVFYSVFRNKNKLVLSCLLSIIYWILIFLSSYFLFLGFSSNVFFIAVMIGVTLSHLLGDVSVLPGGLGVSEGVMFLGYTVMGINQELGIIVALLTRVIFYVYSLVLGGLCIAWLRWNG